MGGETAAPFGKGYIVIKMKVVSRAALYALAAVALPDFNFYLRGDEAIVGESFCAAEDLFLYRFEGKLENLTGTVTYDVSIHELEKSFVRPDAATEFFEHLNELWVPSEATLEIDCRAIKLAVFSPKAVRGRERLIDCFWVCANLASLLVVALINKRASFRVYGVGVWRAFAE